jgi:hypothetical protein
MASDIVFDPSKNAWCHMPSGACSDALQGASKPSLPTYATVADVLEKKNGSGIRLLGWTAARSVLIAPWMMLVGVPVKKAFLGSIIASVAISGFTLLRIARAEYDLNRDYLDKQKWLKHKPKSKLKGTARKRSPSKRAGASNRR